MRFTSPLTGQELQATGRRFGLRSRNPEHIARELARKTQGSVTFHRADDSMVLFYHEGRALCRKLIAASDWLPFMTRPAERDLSSASA